MTDGEINALFKGVEDENDRQNERILKLENDMKQINSLALSVERMATSLETMTEEMKSQSQRIANLEKKPADMWDKVLYAIVTAVVGLVMGLVLGQ